MNGQSGIYAKITEKFVEELKKGVVPWRKPWISRKLWPISWNTKKPYSGINLFLLPMGYGEYATFNQITKAGGKVKKGAKGHLIVFWDKKQNKDKDTGDLTDEWFFFMKSYIVFDILTQAEGLKPRRKEAPAFDHDPIEEAEAIVSGYAGGPSFSFAPGEAFYQPSTDAIVTPPLSDYPDPAKYYSVLFHEMIHSTGHAKRLNRSGVANFDRFGSEQYSKEELIAEIGAAMLCSTAGIEQSTFENSAAYVGNWLEKLQNDHRLIVTAASQAQKATDHILGVKAGEVPEDLDESDTTESAAVA